jgi:tetratricopeptide (TPR) repeat protein
MSKILNILKEEMVKNGETNVSVAAVCNTSPTTVTRFLNESRQIDPSLAASIVRYLCPSLEIEYMKTYVLKVTRPENIRKSMEYCSINRLLDPELKTLVSKAKHDRNGDVRDAGECYEIALRMQMGELSPLETYEIVRFKKASLKENQILLRILEVCSIYNRGEFSFASVSLGQLKSHINSLEDGYIKESFLSRYNELMHSIMLKQGDTKKSRAYCKRILESKTSGLIYRAVAYSRIGSSFQTEDLEKSIKYYRKAQKLYKMIRRQDLLEIIEYNIQFTQILWDKQVDYFIDQELQAFSMIKNGKSEMGYKLLCSLDEKEQSICPIREFIKGEANVEESIAHYYNSMNLYLKKGDRHMANLSRIRLLALGEKDYIVSGLFN